MSENIKKIIPNFISLTIFLVVIFGIYARYYVLVHEAGFFGDEASLIMNIQQRNFLQLFLPLDFAQCAPPFFLILGKLLYQCFGLSEFWLRLIPGLSSILSLILFPVLVYKLFKNRLMTLFSTILFACSYNLLYYSQIFKQYSSDVLFTIVILLFAFWLKNTKITKKVMLFCTVPFALFFLSSYTSAFILLAMFIYYIFYYKDNIKEKIINTLCFLIPFIAFLLPYFLINCLPKITEAGLQTYWRNTEAFLPKDLFQVSELFRFLIGIQEINIYIIAPIFLLSSILIFKKDKFIFSLIIIPIIVAIISGLFHIYPLTSSRVALYLVPIFIIIVAYPFCLINFKVKLSTFVIALFTFLYVLFGFKFDYKGYYWSYIFKSDICYLLSNAKTYVPILEKSDIQKGDIIYIDMPGEVAFDLYDKKNTFKDFEKIYETEWENIHKTLNEKIPKNKNVFYYLTDNISDKNGTKVYTWIKEKCKILYEKEEIEGKFVKAIRIKD